MSDFLGRMAGRALGTLPLSQPLIPSTFAPDAGALQPVVDEIAARPETSPAPPIRITPPPNPARLPEPPESAAQIPMPEQAIPAQPVVAGRREMSPTVPFHEQTREDAPASLASGPPAPLRQPPESPQVRLTAPPEPHETLPLPQQPSRAATAAASSPHLEPPRQVAVAPAESAPPVIRVTIGRIDVRAEFPPAAAPRSAPARRPAPALSLDDYLKQRIEGKR